MFKGYVLGCVVTALGVTSAGAQVKAAKVDGTTIPVVMLSDLHFDPFHDPVKVPLLVKAPLEEWDRILAGPEGAGQDAAFAAIQRQCKAKENTDSSYALLASALAAAKAQTPDVGFVTVSGDLLVHDLDCRYRATMKLEESAGDDQSASAAFAEKTTVYVMKKVEATFAKVPVYLALGNNDSRCNHNRLDLHDAYLKSSAAAVVDGLRGVSAAEKSAAMGTYESAGYYAVTMPGAMKGTRLLVVDDIYMMPKYANCKADDKDDQGAQEQMAWLQRQLEDARVKGQRVWLLGHLPPTVNPASSMEKAEAFCAKGKVVKYQTTDELATEMTAYEDVLKLGVFGHTHMDELHLLRGKDGGVPVKVVGSVSPVSGNMPSFTEGFVDATSSTLMDYRVYVSSNASGIKAKWTEEYAFDATYHAASFSAGSLSDLIGRLREDPGATGEESRSYQAHFINGSSSKKLPSDWRGYVCSLDHSTSESFKSCVCKGN